MFSRFISVLTKLALLAVLAAGALPASAAVWNIYNVQGGSQGGFSYSLLHEATGCNAMCGATIATISGSGAIGTYNDQTGILNATFDIAGSGIASGATMTVASKVSNPLLFEGVDDSTIAPALFDVTFNGTTILGLQSTEIGIKTGYVCCGNDGNDPNSFHSTNPGLAIMSLWGADGFNVNGESYSGSQIGMDLRIELATTTNDDVPEPGALLVFVTALVSLRVVRGTSRKTRA